jgi:phthiocerol/phenolphthiocerol synthesis type-I polyketide synthase E
MHSAMLEPCLADFARAVERVRLRPPKLPVVSSVTGQWLSEREATDPAYWVRHLRETVRFSDALALLLASEERALIEVGPGSILSSLARQHPARGSQPVVATLPDVSAPRASPLVPLGEAWLAGVSIDWERFRAGERRRRVPLPTYSFERERYWLEATSRPAMAEPGRAEQRPPPAPKRASRRGGPAVPARTETERALVECFQEVFRLEEIGIHDDFFALGGDSLMGLRLTARIGQRLGVQLPLKVVAEAPTVAALAERLGVDRERVGSPTAPSRCLVRLQEGTRGPPLVFIHAVGGQALFYRELARCIDPSRPAYGFESVGLEGPEGCHTSVEEMVEHYLGELRACQPSGPYLLVGASFGGMIAYEMARRLSAEGHAVPLCALLDTPGPGRLPEQREDESEVLSFLVKPWLELPPERLRGLSLDAQLQLVLDEAARTGVEVLFSDVERGRRLLRVWMANTEAMYRYTAPRWEGGELQFFRAAEVAPRLPPRVEQTWIELGAAVRVEVVPGDHTSMLLPPHLEGLAARLRACVERAMLQAASPSPSNPRSLT